MTDIEIAHNTEMLPIKDIATRVGIENYLEYYGDYKAKIKESMVPWMIGILVSFGAYGIWRITMSVFYGIL